ncbi:MAG: cytochrome c oxidase subunit I [Gemmatimonadetes bacterium]|nr:cytochrome c oxidase subunit I [Gemmatimonadota bacterium]
MSTTTHTIPAPAAASGPAPSATGLWSWITTVDHKRIGIMYGVTAFIFFLIGGVQALLIRTQLAVPENTFLGAEVYNQMFTMHALTMIFLALMPLTSAFFNYIVPLQIGARDVAFPRLNALSYWIYLFGALFLISSWFLRLAPNVGWFAYANLTSPAYSPGVNVDFYVLGLQILGLASIIASLNFIVTILNLRAPGMRLLRMPVFTWMALVTSVLIVTAMAIFTIAVTQLLFDRFFGTMFFDPTKGGDPVLWQHLFWMFGHPEVYILIVPMLGMVADVIPTFSRKPLFGYNVVVFSGILIAWLGWGVWSHHQFAVGLGPIAESFFAVSTMLIAIPTGVKVFNFLATMWGGSIRFTTSMLFAVGFILMFTIGGISGVMHSAAPADLQQTDTYFVVAHLHYVFFGGTVLGLWSGMYYWFPKVSGRMLDERLGQIHFWGTMVGINLTFFPMHFLGLYGMPRRIFTFSADLGFNGMNLLASVGAYLIGISTLVLTWNLIHSWRRGKLAGPNPWGAATLEWSIPSPPPEYNFLEIPTVRSRMPLWEEDASKQGGIPHGKAQEGTDTITLGGAKVAEMEFPDEPSLMDASEANADHIHLPPPSYWPIILGFGISLLLGAIIFRHTTGPLHNLWYLSLVGFVITLVAVFGFALEPGHDH